MSQDDERRELAKAVVDEMWKRIQTEVGKSVIKKAVWGLIIFGIVVAGAKVGLKP